MEYNIKSAAKTCSVTGRVFQPGEVFYSALIPEGEGLVRKDFCKDAWDGRPEGAFAAWRCQVPEVKSDAQRAPATDEQLLDYFDRLLYDQDQQDTLFILTILLVRRKLFRNDEGEINFNPESYQEGLLTVYCPSRDQLYSVPVLEISLERQDEIQAELETLLYGKSDCEPEKS